MIFKKHLFKIFYCLTYLAAFCSYSHDQADSSCLPLFLSKDECLAAEKIYREYQLATDTQKIELFRHFVKSGNKSIIDYFLTLKVKNPLSKELLYKYFAECLTAKVTSPDDHHTHYKQARILAKLGIFTHLDQKALNNALKEAIQRGKLKLVKFLCENNAQINVNGEDGWSPLGLLLFQYYNQRKPHLISIKKDDIEFIKRLTQHFLKTAEVLMQNGANVTFPAYKKEHDELTPLMLACKLSLFPFVHFLNQHNSPINMQSKSGNTALMYAIQADSTRIVTYLLQKGANHAIRNHKGLSIFQMMQSDEMHKLFNVSDKENVIQN